MTDKYRIGEVSRRTGLPIRTIRFYEAEQIIPATDRTEAGYRLYTEADLERLKFVRQSRLLGLGLSEVKQLVQQAFSSECADFAGQLLDQLHEQRHAVSRRLADLEALRDQLDLLAEHVRHCQNEAQPGQPASDCGFCPLIDEEGGSKP